MIRMVGKNAAELKLPQNMSRIHPVFNISLLMPFVDIPSHGSAMPPRNPQDFFEDFVEWGAITSILDYRLSQQGVHKYLVRGLDSSGLDDGWRELHTIPSTFDTYLRRFHKRSPRYGPGPPPTCLGYTQPTPSA